MATQNFCGFCKRNKEPEQVYRSHPLKDHNGQVTCPQLFKYRCELCGATGPEAHTRSYCPTASGFVSATRPFASANQQASNQAAEVRAVSSNQGRGAHRTIELTNARMYRNMGQVTNSRYNSAGRLRRQPALPGLNFQPPDVYATSALIQWQPEQSDLQQGPPEQQQDMQFWSRPPY